MPAVFKIISAESRNIRRLKEIMSFEALGWDVKSALFSVHCRIIAIGQKLIHGQAIRHCQQQLLPLEEITSSHVA